MTEKEHDELQQKLIGAFEAAMQGVVSFKTRSVIDAAFEDRGNLRKLAFEFFTDPHGYAERHLPVPSYVCVEFEERDERRPQLERQLSDFLDLMKTSTSNSPGVTSAPAQNRERRL